MHEGTCWGGEVGGVKNIFNQETISKSKAEAMIFELKQIQSQNQYCNNMSLKIFT